MNLLSRLLAADEPLFSLAIKQLENTAGKPGQDVRLMSEIIQTVRRRLTELGLDASDTTGEELYFMLFNKVQQHDEHLARHIGASDPRDAYRIMPLIKRAVERADVPRSAWVLKKSVAKRLLHGMPPEKLMKQLGYSSVESMTKRENLAEIYGALRFAETPAWLRRFNKTYKDLTPSDFETRDIEIVALDPKRWSDLTSQFVHHKRYNLTHLKELGVILLLPPPAPKVIGITIATLPIVLHYVNEIRLYSAYFKLQQVKPNFGKIITGVLNDDAPGAAEMAGNKVHWRIVQRHFGRPEHTDQPEIFAPHIQPEDLQWRRAEEQLYAIDPELGFWRNLDYVGVSLSGGETVSFNLMDVSMSYYLALPYQDRILTHMRASLWNELLMRYLGHRVLEQQILSQFDDSMIRPDKLNMK